MAGFFKIFNFTNVMPFVAEGHYVILFICNFTKQINFWFFEEKRLS